jgi:hypothetical protein
MTDKIYVADTGTAIILDCGQDVSSASVRSIEVRKPDGTLTSWAAVASGTTAIRFDSLAGTFDMAGVWRVQAKVTLASGVWRGETVAFTVYANYG